MFVARLFSSHAYQQPGSSGLCNLHPTPKHKPSPCTRAYRTLDGKSLKTIRYVLFTDLFKKEQKYTPIILVQPETPEDRGTRQEMTDISSVVGVLGGYLFYLPALDSFTANLTCAGVSLDFLHSLLAIQHLFFSGALNSLDAKFMVPFLPNLG